MRKSTTKNALLMSALSLFLCFAMLTGTTFAWFTDTVESGVNQIVAGNLDVELYHSDKAANKEAVTTGTKLFDDVDSTKWEPGAMAYEVFTVENKGNLALKYELTLNAINPTIVDNVSFASMLKVAVIEDETFVYTRENIANITTWNSLATFTLPGTLEAKAEGATANPSKTYGIVIWWQPSDLDNLFNMNNGQTVGSVKVDVGVKLVATQLMAESDSFGPDYDEDSQYPALGSANIPANSTNPTTIEAGNVDVTIPAGVPAGNYSLQVSPATTSTDASGKTTVSMDINLNRDGVKVVADGTLYTVSVELGKNLEVTAVTHNGNNVASFSYDPATGIVTFTTESFSPFAFTYTEADDESVFVPADPDASESLKKEDVVAVDENGNEYTNITDAVKSGATKLYFKEGADLGTITHLDVANDLVIYGNGAKLTDGNRDLAVNNIVKLDKDVTITVYNLHGVGFWGNSSNGYTLNLNLYNCNDVCEVYINGTSGVNNIALYNCTYNKDTLVGDTGVYSNANGSITIDGCTFTNIGCPVNLNHKIAGEQTVTVTNTTFVDCATEGTAAYYAPIRLYNSVEGANQTLTVKGNTFTYSEGKAPINKADVLLNAKHNGVDAAGTIKATVQAGAAVVCGENVEVVYTIANADELLALSDKKLKGTYELIADIDLGGAEFKAMSAWYASVTFNGNDHIISNAKVVSGVNDNSTEQASMFFVSTNGSLTVSNLTLKDITVATKNIDNGYAAAVVGYCEGALVLNNVDVVNADITGSKSSGLLVGHLTPAGSLIATECDVSGNITITDFEAEGHYAGEYVGTIAGNTSLNNCTANVTLEGNLKSSNNGSIFGRKVSGELTIDGAVQKAASSQTELNSAVASGNVDVTLSAGNYGMPGTSGDVSISGTKDTVITVSGTTYGSNVTFNGVTVKGSGYATGVNAATVTYNNATIVGDMCLYKDKVVFNNCTFELNGQYIWTYGAAEVEFNNCTFNTTGKAILIYNEGDGASKVTVKGCTFNATAGAKAGAIANQNCAAIEIDNFQSSGTGAAHVLVTEGNTYSENFSGEWRIKNYVAGNPVTVNGTEYTQIAIDGKLMTIDADKNVTVAK